MEERGEGGAEFADVDYSNGRFGGCCEPATASYSGINGSEELFLWVDDSCVVVDGQ